MYIKLSGHRLDDTGHKCPTPTGNRLWAKFNSQNKANRDLYLLKSHSKKLFWSTAFSLLQYTVLVKWPKI